MSLITITEDITWDTIPLTTYSNDRTVYISEFNQEIATLTVRLENLETILCLDIRDYELERKYPELHHAWKNIENIWKTPEIQELRNQYLDLLNQAKTWELLKNDH